MKFEHPIFVRFVYVYIFLFIRQKRLVSQNFFDKTVFTFRPFCIKIMNESVRSRKCDDGGEGRYTNERVCSGGRGLKNADHRGADTYAYSGVCAADPAEKYQKGYEMNSSSSRRKKCHSPGSTLCHQTAHPGSCCQSHRRSHKKSNQSTQDDSEKKSTYRTPTKSATCSPSNPCHSCKSMKEQLRESSSCPQKRVSEKGTSDRCVQKGKQTQQQQQQSKLQQNPCPALEEIMKIKRKNAEEMGRMDYVVGCTCGSNDRQKQIENLSRITQKKSPNVPYQQQQQAPFSGRKTVGPDKRQQATGYQCSVPSQGGVPGSGAIPKKRTMQPTNAGLSQCHTECRVKGETCCVKTTKPKQEYETKMASPPVKGLHVVGMTPPPQPAPQQQQQKAACPQLPPPSIFTHLAESFYDQQFVDDLSSGSDENGGEEDAQNAVCNPIALPYMKNEGAENFQCEDAQTDEGADCYSSSSENVTNKGVNGACVYDNAEGGAYAKTPQAMKSNVGEPPSRRKMQVCAPPNSPANMSRYPENYPKAQMFGMEQRIHPSYQCPGCQSPDDHLNMKSMTSTPCAGKAVAPDEFFSDVSEIIDETPQYNQYQDEDEVLVQGQPYSTGRGAVSMKSFAMTGRHKYEDQGNNQMDESQSFVSLQDFDQSDMSQTPRAFQKQKMGRSFGMDSNYARALWIQAFGPQDGQDPDATTDGRGRRRTDGGVPQGYCPRDTRDPRESFRSSRYGDFSDTLRDYDSRNITRMTDSPRYGQCNRSQRSMQNHSYLRDQSTWAESSRGQDNENSNSRWTDWPEYRKKFHDDRCQLMQNTRM
ncbi:UNVERIFIED_CONTAM: hypothetical protein PYX00_005193 [Menopon gallinae]|uniref:Uncharacterized protein n=1 Tax=Menopon gallinae TaxID=328185 RepID=A0AAW2HR30_9NEOP